VYRSGPRWHDVTAADINDYLREVSGGEYTAKDFRTWHATSPHFPIQAAGRMRTEQLWEFWHDTGACSR